MATGCRPDIPLVVAANRDEYRARSTAPAEFWADAPDVLAGRDLTAGGTWLAVSRTGRFAAVTNVREGSVPRRATRSRGVLVSDFVRSSVEPEEYLRVAAAGADSYDGFNLLVGGAEGLFWLSNRSASREPVRLAPGVHGVSNALLDTPWPKLTAARERMESLLR